MAKRRLQELENSFNLAANMIRSDKIEITAPNLLQMTGNALGCDWGTYWKVDFQLHRLCPIATWSKPGLQISQLENDTKSRTLSLSEGNAGHVWRSRKPIWTLDLVTDMCLPRSLDANNAGLDGGIWFAVKTDTLVYGVLELLGKNLVIPSEELLTGIESFGANLGNILSQNEHEAFR